MGRLEELVLEYDRLAGDPINSGKARSKLMEIGAWDGPLEELEAALSRTRNGSQAAEILKKKIDAMDAPHRYAVSN